MRAREFVTEAANGVLHDYQEKALAGAKVFPNMDQFYELYRFGLAMAGSPDFPDYDPTSASPAGNHPSTVSYTKGEEDIIQAALKKMGKDQYHLTSAGSSEPKDTNNISPVSQPKKNRYGV
jgi:hypothetical protein